MSPRKGAAEEEADQTKEDRTQNNGARSPGPQGNCGGGGRPNKRRYVGLKTIVLGSRQTLPKRKAENKIKRHAKVLLITLQTLAIMYCKYTQAQTLFLTHEIRGNYLELLRCKTINTLQLTTRGGEFKMMSVNMQAGTARINIFIVRYKKHTKNVEWRCC